MVGTNLEVGDLVWAQMKSYPPWPSRIDVPPTTGKGSNAKKGHHYVYFFGSKNFGWVPDEKISPHSDMMIESAAKKKSATFQKAIDEIVAESNRIPQKPKSFVSETIDSNSVEIIELDNLESKDVKMKKSSPQKKEIKKETPDKGKNIKKRPIETFGFDLDSLKRRKSDFAVTDKSIKTGFVPPPENFPSLPSGILQRGKYTERPSTPPLDVEEVRESLITKCVKPTTKKIGFLGMGALGRGIVKNLLNSGHKVTIWNRTPTRYDAFAKAGAQIGTTPADVIESCDITFSCVSDPDTLKTLVFGNCGVLKGLEGCEPNSKGYVEMTGIDSETSEEIAKAICSKGGRYLEAPVNGSRSLAEEGQLLVFAAGDRELFSNCQSCLSAITKHAYFISPELGNACKMNLILSMFKGTLTAALAEAMALISRCKLDPEMFMAILKMGTTNCPLMREKGSAMKNREYTTDVALKHQQKDLTLALSLANSLQQPLLLSAAANEIYKRAKLRCYADHDVSAVIEGTRF